MTILPPLFRLGNRVMRLMPPRLRYPAAALTGRCALYFMPRRRQVAFENYAQVLGVPSTDRLARWTAHQAFGNYFKMIADFMLMHSLSSEAIRRMVVAIGTEHLDAALARGRGAIVVTAHVANWDILAAAAAVRGYIVNAVTNELPSGGINELVVASRERIGMRMIPPTTASARAILKALGRNEVVALVCDLYQGERGVRVSFFGRPTMFPSGPAAIALKTGAPIVPVWVRRGPDNRYVAEVEPALALIRTGNTSEDLRHTTQEIASFFERIIRRDPSQWLVFLPMWRSAIRTAPLQPALDAP